MGDDNAAPDFTGALAAEFGLEPESVDTAPQAPTPESGEGDGAEAKPEPEAVAEEQVPDAKADKPAADEPATPQGEEDATEKPKTDEAPKYATKDDVLDAMRQYNEETTGRLTQVKEAREQIIEKLHPEGIDTNIYDTNGNAIKTAQDIVDRGLLNERTGEPFTYDEAASFMLQAQQKMAQNVEELNNWADNIAEQNISLKESNLRVMEQFGDLLKAMPNVAQQLAEKYVTNQLEWDPTGSYITKMHMTPEDFYTLTMAPYRQLGEALAQKEQLEAATQQRDAQNEQSERQGLPQRGQSHVSSNTGNEMLDALIDEMNKA